MRIFSWLFLVFSSVLSWAQPTITSFTPTSGSVGTTVTITGTGFSTTAANNIVYFGAVRGAVSTATATQLTVPVPAGATFAPITVTVSGLTRQSLSPFTPTFSSNGVIDASTFASKVDFTAATGPSGVASGDLDGDGKVDVVVSNINTGTISIYRNTSSSGTISISSFATKFDLSTGTGAGQPSGIVLSDLDGDGKLDIAVRSNVDQDVSVYRNISTVGSLSSASFASRQSISIGNNGYALVSGDVDGDGKIDLITTGNVSAPVGVYILRNTSTSGTISFASSTVLNGFAGSGFGLAFEDLDGDGKRDIIETAYTPQILSLFRNGSTSGNILFDTRADYGVTYPQGVVAEDIDNDGKKDILVANYGSSGGGTTISVFKNQAGTGSLTTSSLVSPVTFTVGQGPQSIKVADVNGDSKPDVLTASFGINGISVLKNNSATGVINSATFQVKEDFSTGVQPYDLVISDIDGDGRPDVGAVNYNGGGASTISILRNQSSLPTPTITSFAPNSGSSGTTVTITGTNFSTTSANNIVYFGGVMATVTAATATQLTVTVPVGATQSPISVAVNNLNAYSRTQFKPIFNGQGILDASTFSNQVDLPVASNLQRITSADLDGDGKVDLIASHFSSPTISVLRNTASTGSLTTGSFATKVDFTTAAPPFGVEAADIDSDGKLDIVAANYSPGGTFVSVFRNISTVGVINTSSLSARIDLPAVAGSPYHLSIHDLDGDGKPDIVFGFDSSLGILRNISTPGNIAFASAVLLSAGVGPGRPVIEDLDGDGRKDIAFPSYSATFIGLYRNISSPGSLSAASFSSRADITVPQYVYDLRAADLDDDGKPDLVASYNNNSTSSTVFVYKNQANSGTLTAASFASALSFTTLLGPSDLILGDVTGDGKIEIITSNYQNASISVLRNATTTGVINSSSFSSRIDLVVSATNPSAARGVTLADFDGDGRMDLATPNINSSTLSIFRNQASFSPPTITSFTPTSGALGASVTITGTNFSTTPANNIVYFGSVKANVTTATATQLTVGVPVGASSHPVSVTVNNLTAYSQHPFKITFSTGVSIDATSFQTKTDFATGSSPYKVTSADLDNDGKLDLISANSAAGSISLFRNTSTAGVLNSSSLAAKTDFTAPIIGAGPTSVISADFDGDGKLDLATANYGTSSSFSVFRNTHTSGAFTSVSLATRQDFVTQNGTFEIAAGDLDLDGKPDVVVVSDASNIISVYRNLSTPGSISFATKIDYAAGTQTSGVEIADIDGDGKPEILTANFAAASMSVFRNTGSLGTISFSAKVDFTTAANPYRIIASDFDNDGKLDVATSGNSLSILRNTSSTGVINASSFAAKQDLTSNSGAVNLAIGDFDGDGKIDLAQGYSGLSTLSVYRNTSSSGISFAPKVDFTFGASAIGVETADLDGDAKADLISVNGNAATLSIARNALLANQPTAQPTALSFSSIGVAGYTVSFTVATGTPTGYLVLRRSGSSPTDVPVDGTVYSVGNNIGTSSVAYVGSAVTFSETSLAAGTEYFYDVFAYNGSGLAVNYLATTPLEGSRFTLAAEPSGQPTNFLIANRSTTGYDVTFSTAAGTPSGYLILERVGAIPTGVPVDGTNYTVGSVIGDGTVVQISATPSFTKSGLGTTQARSYAIFAFNGSGLSSNFLTSAPLTGTGITLDAEPTAQPTALQFSNVGLTSFTLSFTAAAGNPTGYLILRKAGSAPAETPVDGIEYTVGQSLGTSVVVASGAGLTLNETGLGNSTEYFYAVFSYNNVAPSRNYLTTNPLRGSQFTLVTEPTAQPTASPFTAISPTSVTVNFTAAAGSPSGYLVIRKSLSSPTETPTDGVSYAAGSVLGSSTVAYVGAATSFTDSGLTAATTYFYDVFSYNGSGTALNYLVTNPLEMSTSTLSSEPGGAPTGLTFTSFLVTSLNGSFTASTDSPSGYIVLRKAGSSPSEVPVDGATYTNGVTIGTSTVVSIGNSTTFTDSGLDPATTYHYDIYSYNGSGNNINYGNTPLEGSRATLATEPAAQPVISISNVSATGMTLNITAATGNPSGYLILRKVGSSPLEVPVDGTAYTDGQTLGTSSVVYSGPANSFAITGLVANTTYFFDVFSFNGNTTTVNYLTTSPREASQTTLGADNTPPSVSADRTVTSISTGTNLLVDVDVTDTGSGVNEVTLQYRTVNATSPNFTDVAMTKGTGNAWTQTIPAAAITELGVEYRIKMKDVAANEATSAVKRVAVTFPAAGAPIVYTSFGNAVANYRIVAIPLSVTNNAVSNVFDEFGTFDETQWRVFHYDNSRTPALQPLTASSLLEPGKGYWLISNKQVSAINTGPGNSVSLTGDAFEITLNQGWNQIGNPFNFDISWTDIRTANPTLASQLGTTARTWTGSQVNIDEIKKSEGAYINFSGASGVKLKIPATKNPAINGRLSQSKVINAIDQPHWEVMFRLENSTQSQEINGLGMHPEAHDGLDGLDDYNLPRFFSYLEIVHPKRVADMIVAKDMVPAQSDYVWSFSIETSEKEPYTLRWENGYFGNNERQIWLVDETTGMSVNMRDKQEIKFSYLPQRKMKVVYGSLDFVSRTIASEKISLWSVPNPVASKLSTTVVLPKADQVSLSLIDTKGTMTQLLYEGELKSGMHQLSFNLEGMSNGLYLLKLTTSAGIKFEKILKQE